ncbi:MAG TPA: alpha-amylase family protein [Terriglobia bacterium]|nr:alpha-amylase family protein [Terriglobia bacterium]
MNRRDLLKLTMAGAFSSVVGAKGRQLPVVVPDGTSLPATYIIDYRTNHLADPGFVAQVAEAPPSLLHLGHDVPFTAHWGPRALPLPVKDLSRYRLLNPQETSARAQAIEAMVRRLHGAGVEIIFPYINSQQMGGDLEKRLGFWKFYDHWDEYLSFGLPPRPKADPAEWLQRDPDGRILFNNPAAYPGYAPQFFYSPCPNNEHWRTWLRFVVGAIARAGFDGVFVDDNIIHCYCRYCREGFKRYLRSRYTSRELRSSFGTSDVDKVELCSQADKTAWAMDQPAFIDYLAARYGRDELEKRFKIANLTTRSNFDRIGYNFLDWPAREFIASDMEKYSPEERRRLFGTVDLNRLGIERPEDHLRWFETQRFWAWSIADLLVDLRHAVAPFNRNFVFVPNWGSIQTVHAVEGRRRQGKNVAEWARGAGYLMFEENYQHGFPGRSLSGGFTVHDIQYKFALANGVRPVVLFGGPHGRASVELAHAEAASGGGGCYVENFYQFPEVRRAYRRFYERRPDLFTGFQPLAQVALAFFFNQTHMENLDYLREVYSIHSILATEHVLFDFLTEETLNLLGRYRVFILPSVVYLSRAQEQTIEKWMRGGGRLIVPGFHPTFYEDAKPRPAPAFSGAPSDFSLVRSPRFQWTTRKGLPGLRGYVYWKQEGRQGRVTLHLLNYDLDAAHEPGPVRHIPISVALPDVLQHATVGKLSAFTPNSGETEELHGEIRDGRLSFELPELRVYRLVEAVLLTA